MMLQGSLNKRRKTISPEMRRAVWQAHMPPNTKTAVCAVCCEREISFNSKAGFECAHITADKFYYGEPSVLYLYPTCQQCNNDCMEDNLLDFVYLRGKHKTLRRMIKSIYDAYSSLNSDAHPETLVMWKVLDCLYGYERFKSGGYIVNDIAIFNIAKTEHLQMLNKQLTELTQEMDKLCNETRLVSTMQVTSMRPRFG